MKPAILDRLAILLSGVCLVHCLAIPVALLLGPTLGIWLAASETLVHWVLLGLAAPLSVLALGMGFRRHRSRRVVAVGMAGLLLMLLGVSHWFGSTAEAVLTMSGVVLVMWAHIRNALARSHTPTHPSPPVAASD